MGWFEVCTGRAVTERAHELRMEVLHGAEAVSSPAAEKVWKQWSGRTKRQDVKTYSVVPGATCEPMESLTKYEPMELLTKRSREQKIRACSKTKHHSERQGPEHSSPN